MNSNTLEEKVVVLSRRDIEEAEETYIKVIAEHEAEVALNASVDVVSTPKTGAAGQIALAVFMTLAVSLIGYFLIPGESAKAIGAWALSGVTALAMGAHSVFVFKRRMAKAAS